MSDRPTPLAAGPETLGLLRWLGKARWQGSPLAEVTLFLSDGAGNWFVFLPIACGGYHGHAVAFAPLGASRPGEEPAAVANLRKLGYRVDVCHCWEGARAAIERYLGPHGVLQERG